MRHGSTGMQPWQKPLGQSILGDLLTALVSPKSSPYTEWKEATLLHYTQGSGWGSQCEFLPPWEKANPFVGSSLPRTWVYLVGDSGGWGDLVCTSRRFNLGVRITYSVSCMLQEVKQQEEHGRMNFGKEKAKDYDEQRRCQCPIVHHQMYYFSCPDLTLWWNGDHLEGYERTGDSS